MSITVELINQLSARREGPALDFKKAQYDWSSGGNLELAKDLMAIANGLASGSAPGYILIGVDEKTDGTGEVIGVDVSKHLDDASMQQKVSSLLNRMPRFSYATALVDGKSVGAFEIHPGGRPFYPLRDQGRQLTRFQALIRNGSSTDVAAPDQVLAWAHEDEGSVRQQHLHDGLSRQLGFLVEAVRGNPFHWSKHAIHCELLTKQRVTLDEIDTSLKQQSLKLNLLQEKCIIEAAHEAYGPISALSAAAFQLSHEHGLVWLSITSSVSQLARLYPFTAAADAPRVRPIIIGQDSFSLAFCELVEQLISFDEARHLLK
jgi:hypothetical protein